MRLIDADALKKHLHKDPLYPLVEKYGMDGVIDAQPTIDAVPVSELQEVEKELIRCKDCKHRDPEDKKCDCGHSIRWQLPRSDEWFCADAEPKRNTKL